MRIAGFAYFVILAVMSVGEVCADPGTEVLVSNSRVSVTRADFDAELDRVPEGDRFEFLVSRERIGRLLQEILIRKTLADQARQVGLDESPQIIKKITAAQEGVLAAERINHLEQEI